MYLKTLIIPGEVVSDWASIWRSILFGRSEKQKQNQMPNKDSIWPKKEINHSPEKNTFFFFCFFLSVVCASMMRMHSCVTRRSTHSSPFYFSFAIPIDLCSCKKQKRKTKNKNYWSVCLCGNCFLFGWNANILFLLQCIVSMVSISRVISSETAKATKTDVSENWCYFVANL